MDNDWHQLLVVWFCLTIAILVFLTGFFWDQIWESIVFQLSH